MIKTMRMNPWMVQALAFGIITLLLIIALPFFAERIQDGLATRIADELEANNRDWVTTELEGRDLTLMGMANTVTQKEAVGTEMRKIGGIGNVYNKIEVKLKTVTPYTFKAVYKNQQLLLSGYMPSDEQRAQLMTNSQNLFKSAKVNSQLSLARGEPSQWVLMLQTVLTQLQQFKQGSIEINDYNIRFTGNIAAQKTAALFKTLDGLEGKNYITQVYLNTNQTQLKRVTPYTFDLQHQGNKLIISGYIPNKTLQKKVIKQLKASFAPLPLDNQLQLAQGQPEKWATVLPQLLTFLTPLQHGYLEITDYDIRLTGMVKTTDLLQTLKQQMAQLQRHNYHSYIYLKAADERLLICQRQFDDLLVKNKVNFGSGNFKIKQNSFILLERLRDTINSCPEFSLEVGGHTDADGNSATNKRLSQQRADAVVDYLVTLGIDETRLTAVGYGDSQPIASNQTTAGKAKNRRIEFKVQVQK